ncbi:MAG: hypothetical protein ACRCTZ_20160 [Sarcina sp.]
MSSLNPVSQTVLVIIALLILAFTDLITTNIEFARAKDEKDAEKENKLKNNLIEKMQYTFFGISAVLVYYVINFGIFLIGHFQRHM